MAKYCPVCFAEFKEKFTKCPTDNVALTPKKPTDVESLVDIYAASGEIEAERIVSFLRDKGIDARESTAGMSQFPAAGEAGFNISVPREQSKAAKDVVKQARADGVISPNGNFL